MFFSGRGGGTRTLVVRPLKKEDPPLQDFFIFNMFTSAPRSRDILVLKFLKCVQKAANQKRTNLANEWFIQT